MTKLTNKLGPEEIEYIKECISKRMSGIETAEGLMKVYGLKVSPQGVNYQIRKLSAGKAINEYSEGNDTDLGNIKRMRHKTTLPDGSKVSALIENPQEEENLSKLREELLDLIKSGSPKVKLTKREKSKDAHLLVIDPADIHVGKLSSSFETGETYDAQIAVTRTLSGVKELLNKTAGYRIEKILLVIGNDILHIDSPARKTTSGTPQDTDGMRYDNFMMAMQLYIDIITLLTSIADVEVVFNPSNHDFTNGFFLVQAIQAWFKNNLQVKWHTDMSHRKYIQYGDCMIGTTHGDGAKENLLPMLMASEQPEMYGTTKHRYIFTHHIHHKTMKDYPGVTIESMRSPSPADSRHHRNGYVKAPLGIDAFIFHPVHGQISRVSHVF